MRSVEFNTSLSNVHNLNNNWVICGARDGVYLRSPACVSPLRLRPENEKGRANQR